MQIQKTNNTQQNPNFTAKFIALNGSPASSRLEQTFLNKIAHEVKYMAGEHDIFALSEVENHPANGWNKFSLSFFKAGEIKSSVIKTKMYSQNQTIGKIQEVIESLIEEFNYLKP